MFATLILFTGYLVCQLGSLAHGNGRRRETMTDATAQTGLMVSRIFSLAHALSDSG